MIVDFSHDVFLPPLQQANVTDLFADEIDQHHQHDVAKGIKQAHGGREAVLRVDQADLVDIGGDDFRTGKVERVLHQVSLLVAYAHHLAGIEDEHDHEADEIEYDEHVWLSLKSTCTIVKAMEQAFYPEIVAALSE